MVTLLVDALKLVIVLPDASWAVRVLVPGEGDAVGLGLASAKAKFESAPALITTLPEVPVLPPEVAVKVPVVALPV